jgi:hypothetical protein
MTGEELKLLKKAVADLELGLQRNAPKAYLKIMAWQAKLTLNELIERKHNDNLDTTRSDSNT